MVPRKVAWIPAVASSASLALLLATGCGSPDASPKPVTVPTITTSPQVSSPAPELNTISVMPTTTVDATTEPPPEPTTTEPPPEPVLPPVETTEPTDVPDELPVVVLGARCDEKDAVGVTRRGTPMVCSSSGRGRLRWQPA